MSVIAPRRMEQSIFKTIVEMANEMEKADGAEEIARYFTEMICDGYYNNKKEEVYDGLYVYTKGEVNQFVRYNGLTLAVELFQYYHFEDIKKLRLRVSMYITHNGLTHTHFNAKEKNRFCPITFEENVVYGEEAEDAMDEAEAIWVLEPTLHNHIVSVLRHDFSQQKERGLRM
jgi:hypothetical protein